MALFARYSTPPCTFTPTAQLSSTITSLTICSVKILPPLAVTSLTKAWVNAPVPPLGRAIPG